jgi:hypothetical protein
VAVEAAEVGRQAATTGVSETETMVTMATAVARSTVGEATAAVATVEVEEEAISRDTMPNRPAERRLTPRLFERDRVRVIPAQAGIHEEEGGG